VRRRRVNARHCRVTARQPRQFYRTPEYDLHHVEVPRSGHSPDVIFFFSRRILQ
jgi:hypothetical protein